MMAEDKNTQESTEKSSALFSSDDAVSQELALNVSGHKQELERNFGLISLCGLGITSGNVWVALGGTLVRCFGRLF